jgi:hypothetical protein
MTPTIPMPGALRWREMYPLIDGDGSCSLIYDLERAAVLEVPEELRFYVAPALETGDLDDGLLSWLVQEDLLTAENRGGWGGEAAGLETGGCWDLGAVHRVDDQVCAHLSPRSEDEVGAALEPVFKQSLGASRIQLSLSWPGDLPDLQVVQRVLSEARRLAASARQEITFQLSLDVRQITPAVATWLASVPVRIQVRCEPFPERASAVELRIWETSSSSLLLLTPLSDRVTVSCVLAGGARLLDLWDWAKRLRVRHLDAVRREGGPLREYRNDLLAICDEVASELEARRSPVDYRPVTRIVRRLMGSEPPDRALAGGGFAWASGSEPYPGLEGLPPDVWEAAEDELRSESGPCSRCWARFICNHSSLLTSSGSSDRQNPTGERCAVWLAEAELAVRLYHRLAHCDPISVLRFIEAPGQLPFESFRRSDFEAPKLPC